MKLVLVWLFGVPLLVGSMVLARSALAPSPAPSVLTATLTVSMSNTGAQGMSTSTV